MLILAPTESGMEDCVRNRPIGRTTTMANQPKQNNEQGSSAAFYFVIGMIVLGVLLVVAKAVIGF